MFPVRTPRTAREVRPVLQRPAVATPVALTLVAVAMATITGRTPGAAEGNDLRVYWEGAEGFALNGNPYGTGFVSPVQFALLLQSLRIVPLELVSWLWLGISAAAVGLLVAAVFDVVERPAHLLWVLLAAVLILTWPANAYGLELGQSSALVGLLLTIAAGSASAGAAGAILAFAVVMKPHLTLLVLGGIAFDEALRSRGARTLVEFVVVSLGLLVLSILYSRSWLDVLLAEPPESWNYWGSTIGANVFLVAALDDWAGAWLSYVVVVATVLLLLGIWRVQARPTRGRFVAALLSATLLVTPYAYPHDYVILTLPIIWSVVALVRSGRAAALVAIPGILALTWLAPMPARYDDARFAALLVPLVLLAGLLVLPDPHGDAAAPQ